MIQVSPIDLVLAVAFIVCLVIIAFFIANRRRPVVSSLDREPILTSTAQVSDAPSASTGDALHPTASAELRGLWATLTQREVQVSRLVAQGLSNGQVARQLGISPHTVDGHLRNIYLKLDITSRVELANVVHDLVG